MQVVVLYHEISGLNTEQYNFNKSCFLNLQWVLIFEFFQISSRLFFHLIMNDNFKVNIFISSRTFSEIIIFFLTTNRILTHYYKLFLSLIFILYLIGPREGQRPFYTANAEKASKMSEFSAVHMVCTTQYMPDIKYK